ncbi:multicopper oxidase family protein [Paenibacillus sp. NPDC057967]|uniref:multicopper oxidase family protein n=1 Tax=Paenibacillus sp. NPDC057967 TaxID=3346293 RepID=UPI0036DE38D4
MYSVLTNISQAMLFLLLIFGLIAANKASKLIFSPTEMELHRRARKLRFWTILPSILAAGSIAADALLAAISPPVFWMDRLLLRTPLALLALALLWLMAWPRLRMLIQRTQSQRELAPDMPRRRHATDTALVAPYKWLALTAAILIYFVLSPPVPFLMVEIAIPLTTMLFVGSLLWMHQSSRNAAAAASDAVAVYRPWSRRVRITGAAAVACAVLSVPLLIAMDTSRHPGSLSMMAGKPDYGMIREPNGKLVKAAPAGHAHHSLPVVSATLKSDEIGVPVTALSGPQEGTPDRSFTLTAKKASVALSSGKMVDVWTYNGQLPGPEIRVRKGDLVEVTLYNEDIEDGATLHWHGLDVPNAEDGVAGATQDAVMPGGSHTYRFIAEQVGTFWYHSHQHSKEAVEKGLFGALIVEPAKADLQSDHDIVVLTHVWEGAGTAVGSYDTLQRMQIGAGERVKLRFIQTDNWVRRSYTLSGTPFKVTAIDGVDLNEPELLENADLILTTGGRYDVEFIMPAAPVYLSVDGNRERGILMSADGSGDAPKTIRPASVFDPTHYGKEAPTPFDASSDFDRAFTMILDNRLAFFNGVPALYDTINGKVFPDTPMYMVKEGELIKTTIYNRSAVDHPMHLHGHHMLVLSRNGEPVTGSPWWSDTLDVLSGEVYEVAYLANNPGVWMDHCHNLQHAAAGMTMHLMYEGVTSPFQIGVETHNHPE